MVISILGTEPYGSIWYDVGSIMNVPNHQPFGVPFFSGLHSESQVLPIPVICWQNVWDQHFKNWGPNCCHRWVQTIRSSHPSYTKSANFEFLLCNTARFPPNHQPDMNMYICYVYVMSRDSWNPLILWIVSKAGKQIMSLTDLSAV